MNSDPNLISALIDGFRDELDQELRSFINGTARTDITPDELQAKMRGGSGMGKLRKYIADPTNTDLVREKLLEHLTHDARRDPIKNAKKRGTDTVKRITDWQLIKNGQGQLFLPTELTFSLEHIRGRLYATETMQDRGVIAPLRLLDFSTVLEDVLQRLGRDLKTAETAIERINDLLKQQSDGDLATGTIEQVAMSVGVRDGDIPEPDEDEA